jgi:hypothetical protein
MKKLMQIGAVAALVLAIFAQSAVAAPGHKPQSSGNAFFDVFAELSPGHGLMLHDFSIATVVAPHGNAPAFSGTETFTY